MKAVVPARVPWVRILLPPPGKDFGEVTERLKVLAC